MFKLIVAGSRDYFDYEFVKAKLDYLLQSVTEEIEIVHGDAKGADMLGKRYGIEKGCKVTPFPADWDTHGKGAGPIRNQEMADYANACVVFRKNNSRGSTDMFNRAIRMKLKTRIYDV